MSMKPMTFFQQGAVAGMQQDAYSPIGIYESENLDIFSSSQSVKAAAWSIPQQVNDQIVDIDHRGQFELHKNGRVWSRKEKKYITSTEKLKGTPISDTGNLTNDMYEVATFGTPQKFFVHYNGDEWETIVVITDRLMYYYLKWGKYFEDKVIKAVNCSVDEYGTITKTQNSNKKFSIHVNIEAPGMTMSTLGLRKDMINEWDVRVTKIWNHVPRTNYSLEEDVFKQGSLNSEQLSLSSNIDGRDTRRKEMEIQVFGRSDGSPYKNGCVQIEFEVLNTSGETQGRYDGYIYIDINKRTYEYYNYLPKKTNRLVYSDWDLIFIENKRNIGIYKFVRQWYFSGGVPTSWMQLMQQWTLTFEVNQKVQSIIVKDDFIYVRSTKDHHSYLTTFDTDGKRLEEKKLYTMKVLSAVLLDWIFYLVAKQYGLVALYAYYWWQLKKLVGDEMIGGVFMSKARYKFNGMMTEWRGKLYLATEDNKIFVRGQTAQGTNAWAFMWSPQDDSAVNEIVALQKYHDWDYLEVLHKEDDSLFSSLLFSDRETPTGIGYDSLKSYLQNFSFTTPVQVGSHFLEKQADKLTISASFPETWSHLDVWLRVNEYHFWHFYGNSTIEIPQGSEFELEGMVTSHTLVCERKTPKGHLFSLRGDLLANTSGFTTFNKKLVQKGGGIELQVSGYDNFCYIGRVAPWKWWHTIATFTNLTSELNLPWIHTYQIKIDGYCGDEYSTPEIYSLHLQLDQVQR